MTTEEKVGVVSRKPNPLLMALEMEGKDHEARIWVASRSWKRKECSPPDTWIFNLVRTVLHFSTTELEDKNSSCFKPISLRSLVMAAVRN